MNNIFFLWGQKDVRIRWDLYFYLFHQVIVINCFQHFLTDTIWNQNCFTNRVSNRYYSRIRARNSNKICKSMQLVKTVRSSTHSDIFEEMGLEKSFPEWMKGKCLQIKYEIEWTKIAPLYYFDNFIMIVLFWGPYRPWKSSHVHHWKAKQFVMIILVV